MFRFSRALGILTITAILGSLIPSAVLTPMIHAADVPAVTLDSSHALYTPRHRWIKKNQQRIAAKAASQTATAVWTFTAPESGTYVASIRAQSSIAAYYALFATDAPYTVHINGVQQGNAIRINQRTLKATWRELGQYALHAGDTLTVTVANDATGGKYVVADAIRVEQRVQVLPEIADVSFIPHTAGGEGESAIMHYIDALVLYDASARAYVAQQGKTITAYMESEFQTMNTAFAKSLVPMTVQSVGMLEAKFFITSGATTMYEFIHDTDPTSLEPIRQQYGADIVILLTNHPDLVGNICGTAAQVQTTTPSPADYAYLIGIDMDCVMPTDYTLTHEMGHLLSAQHQNAVLTPEDRQIALKPFATAYTGAFTYQGTNYTFGTVMYSSEDVRRNYRLPIFSQASGTMQLSFVDGGSVTIPTVGSPTADNARALREYAPILSRYRSPILSMDKVIHPGTVDEAIQTVVGRPMKTGSWNIVSGSLRGLKLTTDGHVKGALPQGSTIAVTISAEEISGAVHEATIKLQATTTQLSPLRNHAKPLDVNGDGKIQPLDALIGINFINANASGDIGVQTANTQYLLDTNGDWVITPADILPIINYLNAAAANGE